MDYPPKTLVVEYLLSNIPSYETSRLKGSDNIEIEFIQNYENTTSTGLLKLWKSDIEPEKIETLFSDFYKIVEDFILVLRFEGLRNADYEQIGNDNYYGMKNNYKIRNLLRSHDIKTIIAFENFDGSGITGSLFENIKFDFKAKGIKSLPLFPKEMPSIPDSMKHLVKEAINTDELNEKYVAERLRGWFFILESFKKEEITDYNEISYVRNFVTHPICKNKKTVEFIQEKFSKAIYKKDGKDVAEFHKQDPSHTTFVKKYEEMAKKRVKELIRDKIEKDDGNMKITGRK